MMPLLLLLPMPSVLNKYIHITLYPRHFGCGGLAAPREFIPCAVDGRGIPDVLPFGGEILEKFAVCRRVARSGSLGTGGGGPAGPEVRDKFGFETIRDNLADGLPRPTDEGIRFSGLRDFGVVVCDGRVGVILEFGVGVARPLRGIRDGVTTTAGIVGGGEPRTLAIGEAFHRGRASIGIRPPVPVPRTLVGL
jgi:hypothetical protein